MFMRKMRDSAKYVMLILALAFVGWLVFEGVNDMRGGNLGGEVNPVVGVVAGRDVRYNEWNAILENQLAAARQSGRSLTEEDVRAVTEQAWQNLVNSTLLQRELQRLGVQVSDSEVRQAFLSQPPSEFLGHPAFQTDGRFDIEKYRRFFTDPATDEATLLQLENYYRSLLPRAKLEALIQSGIYVSDEEAWRFYRDTNERARVRFVRVDPFATVPDSAVSVSQAEIRAYYDEREDDFRRPATARANLVSIALQPTTADSAAAQGRAAELAERVASGEDFAEVAAAESADSISAADGGSMGRRALSDLDPPLAETAETLSAGEVSEPVGTSHGYHVLRLDERSGDTLTLRQIYVPIEMSPATEDSIFDLLDDLEEIALRTDLVTAADSVGVPVRTDVELVEGVDFVPGAGALGVAVDWALGPESRIGDLSQFFQNDQGYHVIELLGRTEEGRIPLAEATPGIRLQLMAEKKKERAAEIATELAQAVEDGATLAEAAARRGWTVEEPDPFRRGDFVPGLGQGTEAIGAAFGTPIGEISGVVDAGDAVAVVEVLDRQEASREAFEEVRDIVLTQLRSERTQQYVQKWLAALRESAAVEDHRERLLQTDETL